jgi:uncharacterized membrane protein YuzA (DUF378 family)
MLAFFILAAIAWGVIGLILFPLVQISLGLEDDNP